MNNKLLPEICKIQYGFAFDSARFSSDLGTPLVRIRDVVRGFSETYTTEECSEEYVVQNGDILIGMDGEFNISRWSGGRAYLNQRVCRLIPTSEVNPLYLFYFMPKALKAIEDKTPFVTVKHLSAKELNKIAIPIPSITEQQKISTVLQNLDDVISLRKQQLSKLDELVKSRFIEMFGDQRTNPFGWDVVTIGDIATEVRYGTSRPAVEGGKYPYLRMNNLTYEGYLDLTDLKYIDIPDNEIEKCVVRNGDVLFNRTNSVELVGKTCVYNLDYDMIIAGYIIRVRIDDRMLPVVLSNYLNSTLLKEQLRSMAKGAVNQANINAQELQSIPIYLPPIDLQHEFVAFVEQIDKSKFEIQKSLEKLETLKKALMQKYFG